MALGSLRAVALATALAAAKVWADEVPDELALKLMLRVVTYDAQLSQRGSGEFVVLVPHEKGQSEHADRLVGLAAKLGLNTIANRPLKFVPVAIGELDASKAAAVLLPAGTSAQTAHEALRAAMHHRLYSLAFDEALVKDGAMIGVGSNDGRPQVLLNMTTARAIGADLSAAVLKVAKTFQ